MKFTNRRLRQGLRALGETPDATPDPGFVARLDHQLRHTDADEIVVRLQPVPDATNAPRVAGLAARPRTPGSRMRGRRMQLGLGALALGATFVTAAAAAAFVISQPPTRVRVDEPAERPTVAAVVASPTTTRATERPTTTAPATNAAARSTTEPTTTAGTATTSAAVVVVATEPVTNPPATVATTAVKRPATTVPLAPTTKATEPAHPTTTDSPGPPATITLTCTGRRVAASSSVVCEWSASDGASSYRLLRGDGRLLVPVAGTRRYEDLAVAANVTYTYLAQAVGPDGVTTLANSNRATVACCLPA